MQTTDAVRLPTPVREASLHRGYGGLDRPRKAAGPGADYALQRWPGHEGSRLSSIFMGLVHSPLSFWCSCHPRPLRHPFWHPVSEPSSGKMQVGLSALSSSLFRTSLSFIQHNRCGPRRRLIWRRPGANRCQQVAGPPFTYAHTETPALPVTRCAATPMRSLVVAERVLALTSDNKCLSNFVPAARHIESLICYGERLHQFWRVGLLP